MLDQSVSINGILKIRNGGKLVFKDFGSQATEPLTLRAKSIQVYDIDMISAISISYIEMHLTFE